MKTDERDIQAALRRRLDGLTPSPLLRARVRQRVAQEEAPTMKRKLSVGLILVLILTLLTVTALAAGLLLSPKVSAAKIADQALRDAYGVTLEMQDYFVRSEKTNPDGSITVSYQAVETLSYVLGEYTVTVKNGKAQSVFWSHDGESTDGGFDSEAWGKDQLAEMLRLNVRDGGMNAFEKKAVAIAEKHGKTYDPSADSGFEENWAVKFDAMQAQAHARAKLSEEEMLKLARQAVVAAYGLTPAQGDMLEYYGGDVYDGENYWYYMMDGQAVFEAQFFLNQDTDPSTGYSRSFVEKDGTYTVYVNVETGVIEETYYLSGLGGNG